MRSWVSKPFWPALLHIFIHNDSQSLDRGMGVLRSTIAVVILILVFLLGLTTSAAGHVEVKIYRLT